MTFTDSTEVSNIFSSLNLGKSDRRNSTPTRVLKLLNKDMSDQLTFLFHQAFFPWVISFNFEKQQNYTSTQKLFKVRLFKP